jgi:hypothetical protein
MTSHVRHTRRITIALMLMLALPALGFEARSGQGQGGSRTFPETGKTVQGKFLQYWNDHGGLTQQGFPISAEMRETSDTDGKTYTVQYFERAAFELHPENPPTSDVLLSLLGNFLSKPKYPNGAPSQQPNTASGSILFKETGKRLGGIFLSYWQSHGSLAQQGFPISDEFMEKSDLDHKTYRVQYFERAVFEYHPEKQPPFNVLLSQLGTFRYRAKYSNPTATPAPPTRAPMPTVPAAPTATHDPNVQEVNIELIEWAIVPAQVEVSASGVRFIVTNNGINQHNLTITNASGTDIAATSDFNRSESPRILDVQLTPGTYRLRCSLPGHELAGQRGVLVVR